MTKTISLFLIAVVISSITGTSFPAFATGTGQINGMKWNDANGNGMLDAGETPLGGVMINITQGNTNNTLYNTVTALDGTYSFSGLDAGNYTVLEKVPLNHIQTFPFSKTHAVNITAGQVVNGIDFGNMQVSPGSINGTIWKDTNGNGIIDAGETGFANVYVYLYHVNLGSFDTFAGYTQTDANGKYGFLNIAGGFYRIQVSTPYPYSQSFPANGQTYNVLVDGNAILDQNFGFVSLPVGQITGTVWNDANKNGVFDAGETTLNGVQVCVSNLQYSCTTTFNGQYTLYNIPQGTYTVYAQPSIGVVLTTPNYQTVSVLSGQTTSNVNFGATAPTPPPPEVTITGISSNSYSSIPVNYFGTPTDYTKDVGPNGFNHCGADKPTSVELVINFPDTGGMRHKLMTQHVDNPATPVDESELWSASFSPFVSAGDGSTHMDHGIANLTFNVQCPAGPAEVQDGGNIYIDPSGQITDICTAKPVDGVTVTLVKEDPPTTDHYITPKTTDYIPKINPQITDTTGNYGWDVIPGVYKVFVEKTGYKSVLSNSVTIPPAVTDLNISLEPINGCSPSDTVPPEAYNQFNPITKDVSVFGVDDKDGNLGSITPTITLDGNKEVRTYDIHDSAGNKLVLVEKVKKEGNEIKIEVQSLQYNNGPVIKVQDATKKFEWSTNKDGTIKELEQKITVGKGKDKQEVDAKYDSKKNQTTIEYDKPKSKEILSGMILLKMQTNNGNLVISH